jgi:hypothetical protein
VAIRTKRRLQGEPGPPEGLVGGELAFNEIDDLLYYGHGIAADGRSATEIIPIAGGQYYVDPPNGHVLMDDFGIDTAKGLMPYYMLVGNTDPEGIVLATPGAFYQHLNPTAPVSDHSLWVKESGTGNTGWQAVATQDYVMRHIGLGTSGTVPEAPSDGSSYGRKDTGWTRVLPMTGGTLAGTLTAAGGLYMPWAEVGNLGAATTPYIDFHSSGTGNDFDARFIATGGSATTAQGTLTYYGAQFTVASQMAVTGTLTTAMVSASSVQAKSNTGNAFIGSWDVRNSNVGMWNNTNTLFFGNADGNNNVVTTRMALDVNSHLSLYNGGSFFGQNVYVANRVQGDSTLAYRNSGTGGMVGSGTGSWGFTGFCTDSVGTTVFGQFDGNGNLYSARMLLNAQNTLYLYGNLEVAGRQIFMENTAQRAFTWEGEFRFKRDPNTILFSVSDTGVGWFAGGISSPANLTTTGTLAGGGLASSGDLHVSGVGDIGGTLVVGGKLTAGAVASNGDITSLGTIASVDGLATNGLLHVDGAGSIGSSLAVGTELSVDTIAARGRITTPDTVAAGGLASGGNLAVAGVTDLQGKLTVRHGFQLNGISPFPNAQSARDNGLSTSDVYFNTTVNALSLVF